jgi:hypothetical protein
MLILLYEDPDRENLSGEKQDGLFPWESHPLWEFQRKSLCLIKKV